MGEEEERKRKEEEAERKRKEEEERKRQEEEERKRKEEEAERKRLEEEERKRHEEVAGKLLKVLNGPVQVKPTLGYTFYSFIQGNNITPDDLVAVVINGELRGKAPLRKSSDGKYIVSLNINLENDSEPEPE